MKEAARLTENDFYKALEEVILPEDDVIVFYSGIWTFGHHFGWEVKSIADRLLNVIEDFIGRDRTLLLPSFCASDFMKTRKFDLQLSRPSESGIMSECALNKKDYHRTKNPLHSFLVKGPKADEVLSLPCTTSWGDDGILGWMGKINARICPLGLPWHQACSYFHRIEEVIQIPYRYYKRFSGILLNNGRELAPCAEVKYSYSLNVRPRFDHSIVYPIMKENNCSLSCSNPLIPLESAKTISIDEVCLKIFSDNPYAYVINVEEVKEWVEKGKAEEIAQLAPDERWP